MITSLSETQLGTVAVWNRISPGMVQCCTKGSTLLVCISISSAPHYLAVIFSSVKPTGNSRHSFAFFSPHQQEYPALFPLWQDVSKTSQDSSRYFCNNLGFQLDYFKMFHQTFRKRINFSNIFSLITHTKFSMNLPVLCRPLQDLWGTHKLHIPGGLEDKLLLAKSDSRPFLHGDSSDLLSWLRSDWSAPAWPTD